GYFGPMAGEDDTITPPPFRFASPAVALQRIRATRRNACFVILSALLVFVGAVALGGPWSVVGIELSFCAGLAGILQFLYQGCVTLPSANSYRPAIVTLKERALAIRAGASTSMIDRSQIALGWLDPSLGLPHVILCLRSADRISIGCPDERTARALLDALELG